MKYRMFVLVAVSAIVLTGNVRGEVECYSAGDCDSGQYCAKDTGDCEGKGACQSRPTICPLLVWMPVCGCDGQTYGNACDAAAAGMNVNYEGQCQVGQCSSNADCAEGKYCRKDSCDAANGRCEERPQGGCPEIYHPVCGCDGTTYGNECEAASAGVNIAHEGECSRSCGSNDDCTASEYCFFDNCAADAGLCSERPQGCPDVWHPVCGCDGTTYGNSCEAATVGVSVDYEGECQTARCWSNDNCNQGEYCFFEECALETGVCSVRPGDCPRIWAPVCGCDGTTYGNDCEAAAAGVSVDYEGECKDPHCWSNASCAGGQYCFFHNCAAETGVCTLRPFGCPDVWAPVCGNDCEAAAAGVSVDYEGECVTGACGSNAECDRNQYCAKADGDCDGEGACQLRPQGCPKILAPVCGCDGVTYSNDCLAATVGVNVLHEGWCETRVCDANSECGADGYCAKATGDCSGQGVCSPRPENCPMVWDPVCGCDGQTYINTCLAAMAGANVDYEGQCLPPGPTIVMREPKVAADDIHTGASGISQVRILWSEAVVFGAGDISIVDEDGDVVSFAASGSGATIMTIGFVPKLLHNRYMITIADSVVSVDTGNAIDGDDNGMTGGDAVIVMEHRERSDFNNSNMINWFDFAVIAAKWLDELN